MSAELERARALLDIGRDAEAADVLRRRLGTDPEHAETLGLLSIALRSSEPQHSYEAAIMALRWEPNSAWYHVNAAWSAQAIGRSNEALGLARAAVAHEPHWADGHRVLSHVLCTQPGEAANATAAAQQAIQLAPDDPANWIAAGNVSYISGSLAEARLYYERALALDPAHPTAMANLADLRSDEGSMGHAMDLLQTLIRLQPTNQEARAHIDELASRLLGELIWLSLPIGIGLAIIVQSIVGEG